MCSAFCPVSRCHVHCSGVPCVADSTFGQHECKEGEAYNILWIFIRQRLDLKEPAWVAECVENQGMEEYERGLGEIFYLDRTVAQPADQGWRTRHGRQYMNCA